MVVGRKEDTVDTVVEEDTNTMEDSNQEMSVEESDAEDSSEDVYIVERITAHKTKRNGQTSYQIKWKDYPESENTWEVEENILDKAIIKEYWDGKEAEKAARANKRKSNGQAASKASIAPSPATKESKRRREEVNPTLGNVDEDAPDADDWEPLVKEIETIDRVEDGTLIVFVQWKDGKTTEHPAKVVYKKCPQAMLKFYEERLRFRSK